MGTIASQLRGLSPLGPIFGKELRTTARRKRTYILRFLYLAALLLLLLFFFAIFPHRQHTSVIARELRQAEMGAWFFSIFAFFNVSAMALVGPILTCTAINSERLRKTLSVLLMTPISAWQIVCGKLLSRLWIALTLIGLSLPVLAVVRLLGGIEAQQVLAAISITVSVTLAGAALGLLLSTLITRAFAVILLSYGAMGFLYGLLPLIAAITLFDVLDLSSRGAAGQVFFYGLCLTNPIFALFLVAGPGIGGTPFRTLGWEWCVAFHLGIALLLIFLSGGILRWTTRREHDSTPAAPPSAPPFPLPPPPALQTTSATLDTPTQPPSASQTHCRTVSDNPVLWREIRRPLLARRWQAITTSLVVLGILGLIYSLMHAANALDDSDVQVGFSCIFCGTLTVLTCVIAGTAIAQEKESDTWTLLLTTPMTGWQIIGGKVIGLFRRLAWPAILIVAHFLLFAIADTISWTALWVVLWLTFTTNSLWLATGLYWSLRTQTVIFAIILNLLGPVVLYLLVLILLGIVSELLINANSDLWIEIVGLYAPYPYMVEAIEHLRSHPSHYYNYYDYAQSGYANSSYLHSLGRQSAWVPLFGQVPAYQFLAAVFFVGLAYLFLAGLILWHTARYFNRIVGRANQEFTATTA